MNACMTTSPEPVVIPPHATLPAPDAYEDSYQRRLATSRATIECAAERYGDGLVLSTSFGIQAALMLHLTKEIAPGVPVVLVDTGYLPAATHAFAAELTDLLDLDLRVYRSPLTPAEMEARHGRLWESDDVADLDLYDRIRKVEPMQRALRELGATAWLAGLRAEQTAHRSGLSRVGVQDGRAKILPIIDWTTRNVHDYLKRNDLPLHPYFELGYATVGDEHSSGPLVDGLDERATRFRGLKEECGLHL